MGTLDLLLSRKALAAGVGLTTRRNKVLPPAAVDPSIPARIGAAIPQKNTVPAETVEDRTFIFSLFNGTSGIIANRVKNSNALRIVRSNVLVSAATYAIAAINTFASKWMDGWRIDGLTFMINGQSPPPVVGVSAVPAHDRSALPYVANDGTYYATCTGDATRSTLFYARNMEAVAPAVLSIATNGTQKSLLTASDCSSSSAYSGAGTRLTGAGDYKFYSANVSHANDAVFTINQGWSVIRSGLTTPYLTETGHAASSTTVRSNPYINANNGINYAGTNTHATSGYSITPTLVPIKYGVTVSNRTYPSPNPNYTMSWDETEDVPIYIDASLYVDGGIGTHTTSSAASLLDASVANYGYPGSDIQLALTATLSTGYSSERKLAVQYYPYTSGGSPAQWPGGSEETVAVGSATVTTIKLTSALAAIGELSSVVCSMVGDVTHSNIYVPSITPPADYGTVRHFTQSFFSQSSLDAAIATQDAPGYNAAYNPTLNPPPAASHSSTLTTTFAAKTKDYLYADIEEDVYITLESALNLTRVENFAFNSLDPFSTADTFSLQLKYVLSIRGTNYEFSLYDGSGFTAPTVEKSTIWAGDAGYDPLENFHGDYHAGYKPPPIFAPLFMAQGNCPYIAYTTKAEEAAPFPATPEIYVDFSIKVLQYSTFSGTRYDGVVPWVPHHFLAMFRRYIGGEQKDDYPSYHLTQNTTFWAELFPATPFRLQFSNGQTGAWQAALGSMFSANQPAEITRI